MIIYFKCIIKDLSETLAHHNSQNEFLVDQQDKYWNEIVELRDNVASLEKVIEKKDKKYRDTVAEYEKQIKTMNQQTYEKFKAEKQERE